MEIYGIYLSFHKADEIIEKYKEQLMPAKRKRLVRLRKKEDQLRLLAGDLLMQYGLYQEFGLEPKQLEIVYNTYGKPYISGYKYCYFNISHSHEWVVCAIDKSEMGIDIEKVEEIDLDMIKIICNQEEYKIFYSKRISNYQAKLYEMWTIKESYTKGLGRGLSIPFSQININEKKK
ncbi:hypothetical protein CS063_10070 [Sporanaerobium hydrogeniformans]|uniref:Uncharacterized protein n=1 Tax=Sporanaerobium hydrogeniformans TaxID=3072179 RepID=A0AC61DCH8_9FIRM|nr:4'-phosphopantetheinyl transferase superfamily protein [Sporanaerobium hydrogeniformans]PHV70433.1 hypothetical protein CS063_10070 [Sporanaerobium hydrogeniformans]